jgi:hypothetical protein
MDQNVFFLIDYDDDDAAMMMMVKKLTSEEPVDDRSQFYVLLPNFTVGNISLRSLVLQNECPLNCPQRDVTHGFKL